jgi:hypothetical protein
VGGFIGASSGASPLPLLPTSGARFAAQVIGATRAAGTVGVTLRSQTVGVQPGSEIWKGSLDLRDHGLALTLANSQRLARNATLEQVREVGAALYFHPQISERTCRLGVCPRRAPPARPWSEPGAQSLFTPGDVPEGALELSSPFPLVLLDAVQRWRSGGESRIDDHLAREYSATVSLARAERAFGRVQTLRSLSERFADPSGNPKSSAIPVTVRVWIDGAHRIDRISASEPMFVVRIDGTLNVDQQFPRTGVFLEGSSLINPIPTDIRRQGSVTTTEDFSDYGAASHRVLAPDSRRVEVEPSTILTVG